MLVITGMFRMRGVPRKFGMLESVEMFKMFRKFGIFGLFGMFATTTTTTITTTTTMILCAREALRESSLA